MMRHPAHERERDSMRTRQREETMLYLFTVHAGHGSIGQCVRPTEKQRSFARSGQFSARRGVIIESISCTNRPWRRGPWDKTGQGLSGKVDWW